MIYIVSYKEHDDDTWSDVSWSSQNLALLYCAELLNSGFVVFITKLEV